MIYVKDKNQEYRRLIQFLKEKDYDIAYWLQDIKDDDHIVALYIDPINKKVRDTNVTCIAAWCSGKRYPLNVEEFIDNYVENVINKNFGKYEEMVRLKKTRKNDLNSDKISDPS